MTKNLEEKPGKISKKRRSFRRRKAFKLKLKPETLYTLSSILLFSLAGLIILSFSRQGKFLLKLWTILNYLFGWGIVFLPFLLIFSGLMMTRLKWRITQPNVVIGGGITFIASIGLTKAGLVGLTLWQNLMVLLSSSGAFLILFGFLLIGMVITFEISLEEILSFLSKNIEKFKKIFRTFGKFKKRSFVLNTPSLSKPTIPLKKEIMISSEKKLEEKEKISEEGEIEKPISSFSPINQVWEYPPLDLLSEVPLGKAERGDIKKNAERIEETLESFGISARVVEVNPGPTVTQYALKIPLGTKLSKITALSNDLAMTLAAPTGQIRIEAPIPGRSLVGVEVPNYSPEFVTLRQMLTSEKLKKNKSKLAVGLGLNVSGEPVVVDIGKMPHILIAGATGSGKSVCIHSFINTILFRASPWEVKFILIDPKRVELTQYNGIPHLLTPVIYEPDKVLSALKWAVSEMERRYKLFTEVGVRNLDAYNELSGFSALPYILIIIDELADIMLFAPAEVEDTICRIAQMARATGIHLILSTQRPSVDVLTGLIKANIPCRIAFNVSSQVDSRVIIDMPGAEKLLGRGDMLFIPPDQAKPTRIQGAFISDEEIKRVIEFLKRKGISPEYSEEVVHQKIELASKQDFGEEKDPLFEEAIRIIRQYDRASASLLQRRLKVGYARAARIIDQLEAAGLVGPGEGAKPREVYLENVEKYLSSSEEK
ncbi:MAG: DNA translocase FtsK [Microgenomates group bacterium]